MKFRLPDNKGPLFTGFDDFLVFFGMLKKLNSVLWFYTTPFRVINTKVILAYSCFKVILLFPSILQLVELFRTHKNQYFEVNTLTGNSISNAKFCFV